MRLRARRHLVGERLGGGRERLGVGHLEHGRDAAHHRRAAAGLQVLLVLQPRLAEMHLGVDHAGQHVQARGIDRLAAAAAADRLPIAAMRPPRTPMSRTPMPS